MGIEEAAAAAAAAHQALSGGLNSFNSVIGRVGGQLTSSAADLVSRMADGQTGATLYNRQVNDINRLGGSLLGKIPLLSDALRGVGNAAAAAENQVAKQADAEFKNYQDLSRNGLASSMDSAFKNLTDLSYTFKDMGEGAKLLQANSAVLAGLGGGAEAGIEQFAQISKLIKTSGVQDEFLRMGKSIPDINAGILNYVKYQQQSGHIMQQDSAESFRAAQAYMLEQDKLTKMTGLSADEQQAVRDQAMSTEQYSAHRFLLEEQIANAKDETTRENLKRRLANEDALLMDAKTQGPKALASMSMYLSGNVTTKAAQGAALMYGDLNTKLSQMKPGEALNAYHAADAKFVKDNATLAIAGRANQTFDVSYAEKLKSAARATTDYTKAEEMALLKQQAQVAGEDKTTKLYTDMLQKERETSINLQKAIHDGVPLLSKGLLEIATKTASLSDGFNSIINSITGNTGSGGTAGSQGSGGSSTTTSSTPGSNETPTGNGGGSGKPELTNISINGQSAQVATKYAPAFQSFLNSLDKMGYKVNSLGGYADRDVRGQPGTRSIHSYGAAIDINPATNPLGSSRITDMPEATAGLAAAAGLGWGANWNGPRKDAMHFSAARSEGGTLLQAAQGDILSGPSGGYEKSLGDGESSITLPSGKTVPARVSGGGSSSQTKHYEEELDKLDLMINIMQKQNDVATRMLRIHN